MPLQPKNTLKGWFITAAKPLQGQYWDWMDSYWHKSEMIPMDKITDLIETINTLAGAPPITGSIVAPGGTIVLAAGKIYREIVLTGLGNVSIGKSAGTGEYVDDANIEIVGEDNYIGYINRRPTSALTLYITCTNDITYEIFRS